MTDHGRAGHHHNHQHKNVFNFFQGYQPNNGKEGGDRGRAVRHSSLFSNVTRAGDPVADSGILVPEEALEAAFPAEKQPILFKSMLGDPCPSKLNTDYHYTLPRHAFTAAEVENGTADLTRD
jgi:hypothetical protein